MHAHDDKVMFQETYTDTDDNIISYFNFKIKYSNEDWISI